MKEALTEEERQALVANLRKLALSPDDVSIVSRISAGVLSLLLNVTPKEPKESLTTENASTQKHDA